MFSNLKIAKQHDLTHLRGRWQVGRKGQGSCALAEQSLLPDIHDRENILGKMDRTHRTLLILCGPVIYPESRVTQSDICASSPLQNSWHRPQEYKPVQTRQCGNC